MGVVADNPASAFGAASLAENEPTGFENRTDSVISIISDTFRIAPAVTSYVIWARGNRFTKTGNIDVDLSGYSIGDLIYIKFLNDGSIDDSTVMWDYHMGEPFISMVYIDSAGEYIIFDERHFIIMDDATHEYLHKTRGVQYNAEVGGLAMTFDASGNDCTITEGQIEDEDLEHLISTQDPATLTIVYRDNSLDWIFDTEGNEFLKVISGNVQYDNAGTLANANNFVNYYIFATNALDTGRRLIAILGQETYVNKNTAIQNISIANLNLDGLPNFEFKLIWTITIRVNSTQLSAFDNRTSETSTIVPSTSHGVLGDRDIHNLGHPGLYPQIVASGTDPTVDDDSDDGYSVGDLWINTTDDKIWQSVDVTVGAAIWKQTDKASPYFLISNTSELGAWSTAGGRGVLTANVSPTTVTTLATNGSELHLNGFDLDYDTNDAGIEIEGERISLQGVGKIEGNFNRALIDIDGAAKQVYIERCEITQTNLSSSSRCINFSTNGADDIWIRGNKITGGFETIHAATIITNAVSIIGNVLDGTGANGGINLRNIGGDTVIIGNQLKGYAFHLYLQNAVVECTVVGNVFNGGTYGARLSTSFYGNTVVGNTFNNQSNNSIWVSASNARYNSFANNTIFSNASNPINSASGLYNDFSSCVLNLNASAPIFDATDTGKYQEDGQLKSVNMQTYTITNDSTNRAFDANTVAIAELADVVATLIRDLKVQGLFDTA